MVPWFLSRSEKRSLRISPPHIPLLPGVVFLFSFHVLLHARSIDLICGTYSDYVINQDISPDDSFRRGLQIKSLIYDIQTCSIFFS